MARALRDGLRARPAGHRGAQHQGRAVTENWTAIADGLRRPVPRRRRDLVRQAGHSRLAPRICAASARPWPSRRGCCGGEPKVVVLDYGSGNLRSAERALARAGADVDRHRRLRRGDGRRRAVVPGVGAFAACMAGLRAVRGERIIGRRLAGGRPVLGICVGMQILFERGVEHGVETEGCGEWPGTVERLRRAGPAAHGLEHRRGARGLARCSPGSTPTPASTSCTPTACAPGSCRPSAGSPSRWSPGPSTASRSSPRWRTARCRPPSSTRRSPATPAPALLRNWLRHPVSRCARRPVRGHRPVDRPRCSLPAVDVADGQAVRLVQGAAGTETAYGDPLDAALAWQRGRRRVDPPRRPRRRVRPRLQPRAARRGGRRARREGRAVRRHPRRRLAGRRAGHRLRAGSTSAPPRWRTPTGAPRSSPSTATGSRSASTSAAPTLAARGWTRTAATCGRSLARLDADGCARYVVTDVTRTARCTAPTSTCCARCAPAPTRPVVASGGVSSLDDLRAIAALVPRASRAPSSARPCTPGVHPRGGPGGAPRPDGADRRGEAAHERSAVRVIPCLDVDAGRVVKGVNFQNLRDAGDPVELARRYDAEGADELTFLDITASSGDRETMLRRGPPHRRAGLHPADRGRRGAHGRRRRPAAARRRRQGRRQHRRHRPARAARARSPQRFGAPGARAVGGRPPRRRRRPPRRGFEVTTHGGRRGTGIDAVEWARAGRGARARARSCSTRWTPTAPRTASTWR